MSRIRNYRRTKLTLRLKQVAQLIGKGRSNRQIRDQLGIAEQTLKDYIRMLREMYRCTTRELVVRFARRGVT